MTTTYGTTYKIGVVTAEEMLSIANGEYGAGLIGGHFVDGEHYAALPKNKQIFVYRRHYKHEYGSGYEYGQRLAGTSKIDTLTYNSYAEGHFGLFEEEKEVISVNAWL